MTVVNPLSGLQTTFIIPLTVAEIDASISVTAGAFSAESIPAEAAICFAQGPEGVDSRLSPDDRRSITAQIPLNALTSTPASLSRCMLRATHEALECADKEGIQAGVIDVESALRATGMPPREHGLALVAILGGIRMFVDDASRHSDPPLLRHITLAMGDSAYAVFLSELGGTSSLESFLRDVVRRPHRKPSPAVANDVTPLPEEPASSAMPRVELNPSTGLQPFQVDFAKGIVPDGLDLNQPRDLAIQFLYERRKGMLSARETEEQVFLVNTPRFLRDIVTWKMAFSIFKQGDVHFLYLTRWQPPEKVSPHDIIYTAREQLIQRTGEAGRGGMLQKGYIRAGDAGRYILFDLGGSPYHPRSSSDSGSTTVPVLKSSMQEMIAFFKAQFGVELDIEGSGQPPPAPPEKSYGPR